MQIVERIELTVSEAHQLEKNRHFEARAKNTHGVIIPGNAATVQKRNGAVTVVAPVLLARVQSDVGVIVRKEHAQDVLVGGKQNTLEIVLREE